MVGSRQKNKVEVHNSQGNNRYPKSNCEHQFFFNDLASLFVNSRCFAIGLFII